MKFGKKSKVHHQKANKGKANVKGGNKNKSQGGTSVSKAEFHAEVLACHNKCRRRHNTQAAIWSDHLAGEAQKWANQLAKTGKFQHAHPNQRKGQGENIAYTQGQPLTGEKATMMWYDEIKDYSFQSTPKYNPNCGHFTQVIWADSTEIGAGIATTKDGKNFVVVRYSPSGNNLSTFKDNIKTPVGELEDGPPSDEKPRIDKVVNDDVIQAAVQQDNYCEPEDKTENKESNVKDNDEKPLYKPVPTQTVVRKHPEFYSGVTYSLEHVEITENEVKPQKCETVEVVNSNIPMKAKHSHPPEYDLQLGKKYNVIHYVY